MLMGLEELLLREAPDLTLVYGDTNSTLAGALAASKLHIPVAHIEAGLRSYNRAMPEEINRVLADRISDFLFCPTDTAVHNLGKEGMTNGVYNSGDVMYDAALYFEEKARHTSQLLNTLDLKAGEYLLATVHRPNSTDNAENLENILSALAEIAKPVVFPMHPRTRGFIARHNLSWIIDDNAHLRAIEPVDYLDMLVLEKKAEKIITDSGGIQKEAYFFEIPCITLREDTEWTETVEDGWNILVGTDKEKIIDAVHSFRPSSPQRKHYGDGTARKKIVATLETHFD